MKGSPIEGDYVFAHGALMRRRTALALICSTVVSLPAVAEGESEVDDGKRALVVLVFDNSCRISCDRVRPVIKELEEQYEDRVQFLELDVSKERRAESKKTAESLRISGFFADAVDWYPVVGVFNARRKKVKEFVGAKNKKDYQAAIEKALIPKSP